MADSFDIVSMFDKSFEVLDKKSSSSKPRHREGSYAYDTFDACNKYSQGTIFGVLVPDESGNPFRIIKNVATCWISTQRDDGSSRKFEIKWCSSDNYKNLTDEQQALNSEIKKELDIFKKNFEGTIFVREVDNLVVFYYCISKTVSVKDEVQKYEHPEATIVLHRSFNFLKKFRESVKNKTEALEDPSWMKKFFSREFGDNPNITQIKTTRPSFGYEIDISFTELPKLAVTIDDVILNSTKNLSTAYINAEEYDEAYNKELLEILKKENSLADNGKGLKSEEKKEVTLESPDLKKE